jgi:hypothetical protein
VINWANVPKRALWQIFFSALSWASFFAFTLIVGGDSLNGKIENRRYYVAEGSHFKETTFSIFLVSALLVFFSSIAFFVITNFVFDVQEKLGLLKEKQLRRVLSVFFGIISGLMALRALFVVGEALMNRYTN